MRRKPVYIVTETRTFYLSNGYSVRFEVPSIEERRVCAKTRATLYDKHGRMIDYMLEGEGFNIRDTQMCRKLAVEICEYFLEMGLVLGLASVFESAYQVFCPSYR